MNQAARLRRLEVENARLRAELLGARGFGRLIGSSRALEKTLKQARAIADTSATVLDHRRKRHGQGDAGLGDS